MYEKVFREQNNFVPLDLSSGVVEYNESAVRIMEYSNSRTKKFDVRIRFLISFLNCVDA
jgi:hypothetical protein